MTTLSRRSLLAAAAAFGVARPALAAFEEAPAPLRTQFAIDDRCGLSEAHKQLLAEVEKLTGNLSEEDKRKVVAQLTCPTCGCTVSSLY